MTNITKLYEVAGVEKSIECNHAECPQWSRVKRNKCPAKGNIPNEECIKNSEYTTAYYTYPPFTAEKQLELIKWVIKLEGIRDVVPAEFGAYYSDNMWWLEFLDDKCYSVLGSAHKDFSQALTGLILQLWDELTDTQKEEIKRILE